MTATILSLSIAFNLQGTDINIIENAFAQSPMTTMINNNASSVNLGNPIIESNGMITGQRVLEIHPLPKVETSYIENITIRGGENITASEIATFWSVMKPDGSVYGEGQGIITTLLGETATWTGQGIGHFTDDGKIRFTGSLFFSTPFLETAGKLGFLNNVVGIFVYEIDKDGKTSHKVWEWK